MDNNYYNEVPQEPKVQPKKKGKFLKTIAKLGLRRSYKIQVRG